MATALAAGFCRSQLIQPDQIVTYDVSPDAVDRFQTQVPGSRSVSTAADLIMPGALVVLAVKPQIIPEVIDSLANDNDQTVFVSVMGGIRLEWLQRKLNTDRIVRTMPNTPCLIGKGAIGMTSAPGVTEQQSADIQSLFESVGICFQLKEPQIDAVTGLSGSGPAYIFQLIEALADGGVQMGLPRPVAQQLAAQTVVGAGEMVLQSGEHPGVLKDRVASPGGTTIAGIKALEENGFRAAAMSAVEAATRKSQELGD